MPAQSVLQVLARFVVPLPDRDLPLPSSMQVVGGIVSEVAERLISRQSQRTGVPAETLFPFLPLIRQSLAQLSSSTGSFGALQGHSNSNGGGSSSRTNSRSLSSSAAAEDSIAGLELSESHAPAAGSHSNGALESLLSPESADSYQQLAGNAEVASRDVGVVQSPQQAGVLV